MKKIIIVIILIIVLGAVFGFFYFWNNGNGAAVTDPVLKKIKESGKLVVGVDLPYGVMEFLDENNNPAGIDIDIITEVANQLGAKAEIRQYVWEDLFVALEKGDIDLAISSITITTDRAEKMLFSAPYFNSGQVIVARSDNMAITALADLTDKNIGVQKDTTGYDEAKKLTSDSLITQYDSWENAMSSGGIISDLKEGKTDGVIVDYIQAVDSVRNDPSIRIVGNPFTQEYYGIAAKLGNAALMDSVNTILRNMKRDGLLESIKSKWIKV